MTNRLNSVVPYDPAQKRPSLFSARKATLMASAVAALVMCGISLSPNHFATLGSSAYAGVNNAGAGAAQPVGFADTVERVKPSVISVKVTMKDKATNAKAANEDESDSPMERFFRQFGGPDGAPGNKGRQGQAMGQGSGFFISSDGMQ